MIKTRKELSLEWWVGEGEDAGVERARGRVLKEKEKPNATIYTQPEPDMLTYIHQYAHKKIQFLSFLTFLFERNSFWFFFLFVMLLLVNDEHIVVIKLLIITLFSHSLSFLLHS